MNVHVFVLLPPLEQAPDQIASRPLATDSVIDVPLANDADPVVPTATLMPAGFDRMLVPVRHGRRHSRCAARTEKLY